MPKIDIIIAAPIAWIPQPGFPNNPKPKLVSVAKFARLILLFKYKDLHLHSKEFQI